MATPGLNERSDTVDLVAKLDFLTELVRQVGDHVFELDLCITRAQADVADIHRALVRKSNTRRDEAKH